MDVLSTMLLWISLVTGYQTTSERPVINLVPHSYFVQHTCNGIDTEHNPCDYQGLYIYATRTIYIDNGLDKQSLDAVLIHELTHYLQHVNAKWTTGTCVDKISREGQAYKIQQKYITEVQERDGKVTAPTQEEICSF